MKVRKAYLTFFLLTLGAYVILFPRGVGKELVVSPRWTTTLPTLGQTNVAATPGASQSNSATAPAGTVQPLITPGPVSGTLTSFQLGGDFGFVDSSGHLHYLGQTMYGLALGADRFVNYSRLSQQAVVQDPTGNYRATISQSGYPVFLRNNLFFLNTQRDVITAFDAGGKRLWSHRMGSLITTADAGGGYTSVGLLNGQVDVFDRSGSSVFQTGPGPSSMPVVLGIAISESGERMAVISGIDPQMMTLYDIANGRFTPVDTRRLESDFRRAVLVECVENSDVTAFETKQGVRLVNQRTHEASDVPLPGTVYAISSHRLQGMLVAGSVAGQNNTTATPKRAVVELFLPDGRQVLHLSFPASGLLLKSADQGLLFGADGVLFQVEFSVG